MPPKKAPIRKQVGKVASYDDEPAAKKPRTAPAGKKVVPAPSSDNKSKQAQNKPTDNAEGLHAANQHEKLISDVSQHDYFLFGREIILINDGSSLPELALVIEYQNTKTLIVSMKEVNRTQLHIAVLPTDDHKVILSKSVIVSLPYEHDVRNCVFLVKLSEYNKWVDKCQQPAEKKSRALVPLNTAYAITIAEESTNGEEIKRTTTDKLGFTYETCWKGTDPVNACGNLICWLNKFGYLEKKHGAGKTSNEPFVYMKLIVYVCAADFCQLEGSDKDVLLASKTELDIDSNAFLVIGRKYSFAHLRHYLNLSGPTLGKVLETLEDEGLIFLGGGSMTEKSIVYLVIPPLYPSSTMKPDVKHE